MSCSLPFLLRWQGHMLPKGSGYVDKEPNWFETRSNPHSGHHQIWENFKKITFRECECSFPEKHRFWAFMIHQFYFFSMSKCWMHRMATKQKETKTSGFIQEFHQNGQNYPRHITVAVYFIRRKLPTSSTLVMLWWKTPPGQSDG